MTRMVQLSDEAYRRLQMKKRRGESFSDVVLRLVGPKGGLLALARLGRSADELDSHFREIGDIDRLDRPEDL